MHNSYNLTTELNMVVFFKCSSLFSVPKWKKTCSACTILSILISSFNVNCFSLSVSLVLLVYNALHENLDAVALLQCPHFMCEYKSVRKMVYKSDPSSILNLLKWKYLYFTTTEKKMSFTTTSAESDQCNQVSIVSDFCKKWVIILWFVKQIRIWKYTTNVSVQIWGRNSVFTDTACKWNWMELLCT